MAQRQTILQAQEKTGSLLNIGKIDMTEFLRGDEKDTLQDQIKDL